MAFDFPTSASLHLQIYQNSAIAGRHVSHRKRNCRLRLEMSMVSISIT